MSDYGTIELQIRGNKVKVAAENAVGGATCMVDRWHTYADFLRDLSLITQDHHDAFTEFLELWQGAHAFGQGNGNGTGEKYQEWITFGIRLGPARLRIMNEIRESDPPSSAHQVTSTLAATAKAHKAASQAGETELAAHIGREIGRLQNLLKMREAIISSHRLSARLRLAALHDAMESAQEAFQFLLDEKKKSDL